ncbi:MAG: hypothetical protein GY861_19485 [bacterium]|nr:hypothetical protein [bacterium]
MASVLDLSILEGFSQIFVWILVWVLIFAFLEVTQLLKNRALHAIAALSVAIIVAFSGTTTKLILYMSPWVLMIVFIVFLLFMIGNFMGVPGATILSAIGGDKGAVFWVFIPLLLIFVMGLSSIYGQDLLDERAVDEDGNPIEQTEHQESVIMTLTNPKVVGMVLLLLVGVVTITFLTGPVKP